MTAFLHLTNEDIRKFLYHFYQSIQGDKLPDLIGLSMTEAAWGSGKQRAVIHLQKAISALGGNVANDGILGPQTIAAAYSFPEKKLYAEYWKQREAFLRYLGSQPLYAKWLQGWLNRLRAFLVSFPLQTGGGFVIALIVLGFVFRKEFGL
jgi:lysozyme family protein